MWQSVHMAAEHDMHNPPAAESRAVESNVETHVLDLTTVCVRSGSVLLPRALIGRFPEGQFVAQSDGGELLLEFVAPRSLAGLADLFELHGLRANDRLVFVFEDDALRLTVHKRERARAEGDGRRPGKRAAASGHGASAAPGTPAQAGTPAQTGARAQAGTPAQAGARTTDGAQTSSAQAQRAQALAARGSISDWQAAVERQEAQVIAERRAEALNQKGITVDRFSGPVGELVPQPPRRRESTSTSGSGAGAPPSRASGSGGRGVPSGAKAPARGDAWGELPAQPGEGTPAQPEESVRAVTRVRLEGGVPAGTVGAARPKELASAHDVWARRQHARWQPLDTVVAAKHDPRVFDADFPDTVVRAFRRGPNGSLRPEPALVKDETVQATRPAQPVERGSRTRSAPSTRQEPTQAPRGVPTSAASGERVLHARDAGDRFEPAYREDRSYRDEPAYGADQPGHREHAADMFESPLAAAAADQAGLRRAGFNAGFDADLDADLDGGPDERADLDHLVEEAPAKSPLKGVIARLSGLRFALGRERGAGDGSHGGAHDGSHGYAHADGRADAHADTHDLDAVPVRGSERITVFQPSPQANLPIVQRGALTPRDAQTGPAPAPRTVQAPRTAGGGYADTPAWGAAPTTGSLASGAGPLAPGSGALAPGAGPLAAGPGALRLGQGPVAPGRGVDAPGMEPARQARRAAPAAVLEDALLLDTDVTEKASAPRRHLVDLEGLQVPAIGASVEEDMAFLEGYLSRPGTPAIVRSLDLAERLGISPERAARAMERLSENKERFSRIREGAYMVRQLRG